MLTHGFAVLVTTVALLIQLLLYPYVRTTPFIIFFGAVMLSGWKGGWGPGLTSTGLSALLGSYFFLPPGHSLALRHREVLSVILFITVATLITRLNVRARAARAEAEAQRARLHTLFMRAPAIIAIHRGPEHVFELSNPLHAELLGHREILGKPVRQVQPELEGLGLFEQLDRVYRTGQPYSGQEVSAPVGDPRHPRTGYFNFVYQPMPGPDGKPDGVMVFSSEVTEQVLARRGLEAAERRLTTITQNARLGLLLMDARQHCVFMNPAAEKITGFTLEEVQGKPLHELIHHTRPDGTPYPISECPIDRALLTRAQDQGEDVFVRKDGSFYPVAFTASPILERGKAVGTVIELRDTTEDKRQQAERERLLAELQEAVRLRDEFLSVASHELNTPLTPLSLRLQSLARAIEADPDSPMAERLRKEVEVMRRQVKRLSDLVNELLDVSRISTGRMKLQLEEVDLSEVAREVAARFNPEAERAGSGLELHVEGPVVGRWDRLRLEQVLTNLLSNAIKYGAGKPIHVLVEHGDDRARLQVRDEGIGIQPEALGRIFNRFERAVSERHYGGLGLGLYVTRQIIDAMGGTVRAESTPGQGATFTVDLPRQRASS
ncbi:PAS domain-containing protein [Archangium violaceum]|uniref:sensor histidine kinase n=1 Tax=Archangium violaceum TaxID=83451 RepID=UPI0019529CEA|nr:ATP-binding protein [Archangium violaceum]QRN95321.1 PAS domain-containing protein [Archangium violaceum]